MTSLSCADMEREHIVKWILCSLEHTRLLQEYGLKIGAKIFVVASFYGNVLIHVNGKRVAICKEMADRIKV